MPDEPRLKLEIKDKQIIVGTTYVFVFVGGFALAKTIIDAVHPGDGNNLLYSAGTGAVITAILLGLNYATGTLKI